MQIRKAVFDFRVVLAILAGVALSGCAALPGDAQLVPARPAITGISHVVFYAANPSLAPKFYAGELGFAPGTPDAAGEARFFASTQQYISIAQLPGEHTVSRLKAVYYQTTDAERLRLYLGAHAVAVPAKLDRDRDGSVSFTVKDPDGYTIGFEQIDGRHIELPKNPTSTRIIHVGFAVHDQAAQRAFYQGLLGFRPYWHGGMKDGVEEFVSLQVPDGTDWLEFMLTVPEHPTQQALGVLNHFSLGVTDINLAAKRLEEHGWHETPGEHRQEGRDGKRQLNVFDPDLSRVEFMEFQPFREPCCSAFTGPHPKPD